MAKKPYNPDLYFGNPVIKDRLLKKVRRCANGCWGWLGTKDAGGYGLLYAGQEKQAHRIAHLVWTGEIPPRMVVRHKCHNRSCINPAHLVVGTQRDNGRDREYKRFSPVIFADTINPKDMLTKKQVKFMSVLRFVYGLSRADLMDVFNVSQQTIRDVLRGQRKRDYRNYT